jgi:Pretoxin HINT domain
MKSSFQRYGVCGVVIAVLAMSVQAASKSKTSSLPDDVRHVLNAETQTTVSFVDRRESLRPATRPQNDPNSVWWQSGYLQSGKQWLPFEATVADDLGGSKLDEYQSLRTQLSGQPHGAWKIATWCRKNGFADQERVHLLQVLTDKDPTANMDSVYERLGCQKIGDTWISQQSRREAVALQAELEASYKRWHSRMELIVEQLAGGPKQISAAEKQLSEIQSSTAVPAIVSILCMATPHAAEYGVKTLGQIQGYQASRALAGQAIFSPWRAVRREATEKLKDRKVEEYVPDLLLLLSKPIRSTVLKDPRNVETLPSHSISTTGLNWDYVWVDESQDKVQVGFRRLFPFWLPLGAYQVVSKRFPSAYPFFDQNGNRLNINVNSIIEAMNREKETLDYTVDLINDGRTDLNGRVGKVLSRSTDQPMSDDPQIWWDWWTNYSSVSTATQKSVVVVEERQPVQLIPTVRRSCLVAGTPVWTERGLVAIETILPGDRVLSKDITSGELAYKPVVRTTEREPTLVLTFRIEDEQITASLGHHFWVSGEGWKKTRELAARTPLHTVTGMLRITSVHDDNHMEKVYNLVVADFHTYFVGKSMILSHDVMTPALTNTKVPGLSEE